jgi:hypothetical protein
MQGHWTFLHGFRRADFAEIPIQSRQRHICPGAELERAENAVLIAQIPTVMEIDPSLPQRRPR